MFFTIEDDHRDVVATGTEPDYPRTDHRAFQPPPVVGGGDRVTMVASRLLHLFARMSARPVSPERAAHLTLAASRTILPTAGGTLLTHHKGSWHAHPDSAVVPAAAISAYFNGVGLPDPLADPDTAAVSVPLADWLEHADAEALAPASTVLMVPGRIAGEMAGLLVLFFDGEPSLTPRQGDLLCDVATLGAQAVLRAVESEEKPAPIPAVESAHDDGVAARLGDLLVESSGPANVGGIAGGIAHEINNPLQIIMGKIQIARIRKDPGAILDTLEEQAMRITRLVRGLLMIARGATESSETLIDVKGTILNTLDLLANPLRKSGLDLSTNLEGRVSGTWGNPGKLQQLILTLLVQAQKRMPEGGTLHLDARTEDERIVIHVSDSGDGPREACGQPGNWRALWEVDLEAGRRLAETFGGELIVRRDGDATHVSASLPVRRPPVRTGMEWPG